jgi:hypothetical protein
MIAFGAIFLYSFIYLANASNNQPKNTLQQRTATVTVFVAQSYLCQDNEAGNCNLLRFTGGSSRDTLIMYNSSSNSVYLYVADREGLRNRDKIGAFKEFVVLRNNRKNIGYRLRNIYKI